MVKDKYFRFYKLYPEIVDSVSPQSGALLSWTHYRVLLQVEDKTARDWYTKEAALAHGRELRAEIETQKEMFYLQHNQNKDICGENTKMTKIEKAQESCEQVLNGIEDGTITTTSALLVILYARPFSREEKVTWKY